MKKWLIVAYLITLPIIFYTFSTLNYDVQLEEKQTNLGVEHIYAASTIENDAGTISQQEVNVFKKSDDIMVATWSRFINGQYFLSDTLSIAKDFELNNPDYEVVAGVNGDYFYLETINANVLFNNKVINPQNHQKYSAVVLDDHGNYINEFKRMSVNKDLSLSVYSHDGALLDFNIIQYINKATLFNDETTVILNNPEYIKDESAFYYEIETGVIHSVGQHLYLEGVVIGSVTNLENKTYLATKNEDLISILEEDMNIKIQYNINDISENQMAIGVDGKIIENNKVKEFTEMEGQSDDYNKYRHPRTGFGFDASGSLTLITVDGRRASSQGVNLREFGHIMKEYGIINGYNLDGGGSTQAVFKVDGELEIVNQPSDANLRRVGSAVLFIKKKTEVFSNFTKIEDKININIYGDDTAKVTKTNLYVNGDKRIFDNLKNNLSIDIMGYETYSISVTVTLDDNSELLLKNEVFMSTETKPKLKPDVSLSYIYGNSNLEVIIEYEDIDRMIDRIRVYLSDPKLDQPAIIQNSKTRKASFNKINIDNQEITVVVLYNDQTEKTFYLDFVLESKVEVIPEDTNNLIEQILLISIPVVLGLSLVSAITWILLSKKKRL